MDQERGGRGRCKGEAQGGKGEARGRHRRQDRHRRQGRHRRQDDLSQPKSCITQSFKLSQKGRGKKVIKQVTRCLARQYEITVLYGQIKQYHEATNNIRFAL